MSVASKQKDDQIKIKQYIIDAKAQKVTAVLDIKELVRVNDLIEDLIDLKILEDRVAEPAEDYRLTVAKENSVCMYKLEVKKSARKELADLPDQDFLKIDQAISSLRNNPFPYLLRLFVFEVGTAFQGSSGQGCFG